jgi:murein DD-endopeptidase MepM/ murein hydrolase activator NlpD
MRALPWLIGGGAAAAAVYFWGRTEELSAPAEALSGRWVWPVGVWAGRKPEISDGFHSKRRTQAGQQILHGGVDLMFPRRAGDPYRASTPQGTARYVMPDRRAALAASDGVVWFAAHTPRGWSVILDHAPRKLSTYYTHLSSLFVTAKQKLTAGTPIGIIGADPLDGEHVMHLHFEVRRGGASDRIDPQPLMASWEYLPDPGTPTTPTSSLTARNAQARSKRGQTVPVQAHLRRWPRHGL